MNAINTVRTRADRRPWQRARLLTAALWETALGHETPLLAQASPANPPYPDVQEMIREPLDNVPQGTVACGWDALRYRMRGNIYQSRRKNDPTE